VTRTNKYVGYQHSFDFAGNYDVDNKPSAIIFMDALPGGERDAPTLQREINKAFIGFSCNTNGATIATGQWGCGAFGGNKVVKAILQLMVAAQAGVSLEYILYGKKLSGLKAFYEEIIAKKFTVGELFLALRASVLASNTTPYYYYHNQTENYFEKTLEYMQKKRASPFSNNTPSNSSPTDSDGMVIDGSSKI
jgi:poly(ADP-ribose) glycohydrolase